MTNRSLLVYVKELSATVLAWLQRIPLPIILVISGLVLYSWGKDIALILQTTTDLAALGILAVFLGGLMLIFRFTCSCSS